MVKTLSKLRHVVQNYKHYKDKEIPVDEFEHLKTTFNELTHLLPWDVAEHFAQQAHSNLISEVQSKLTFYADALTGFDHKAEHGKMSGNLSVSILENIFSLLDHFKAYYPEQFNLDARLPDHYCAFKSLGNQSQIQDCIVLMKKHRVDAAFIELLERFLSAGSASDIFQIKTWRQWNLQQHFLYKLTMLLESTPEKPTLLIFQTLISLEINSIQIYSYFVKYQEQLIQKDVPLSEKLDQLNLLVKIFKQVVSETDGFFDYHAPSLKVSVLDSLNAEIAYAEQQEQLYKERIKPISPEGASRFYFKVAITLAELMFFFRVALEVKVMTTKFNTYLYEFVSNHIKTQRAEKFSMQSMRNHYNNKPFPDKVVKVVRGWLVRMIDHIDLYYR